MTARTRCVGLAGKSDSDAWDRGLTGVYRKEVIPVQARLRIGDDVGQHVLGTALELDSNDRR